MNRLFATDCLCAARVTAIAARALWRCVWLGWLGCALGLGGLAAQAGVLDRAALARHFPSPLIVGERTSDLPVWPILQQQGPAMPVVAYAFESIDLAPLPGFGGVPFNLLVLLDVQGRFQDVRVLSQHEPVFLDGLGEAPLQAFVRQYPGLSLHQSIKIDAARSPGAAAADGLAHIDGVAKATASVRILNQTLLAAALQVARARLGFAAGRDPARVARVRSDRFEPLDWSGLQARGLVQQHRWLNRELEAAFAGSAGAGLDPEAAQAPEARFADLYFAWISVPGVGRNLLSPRDWQALQQSLEPGEQALLLVAGGRYGLVGENFVRGTVPDRLTLRQQGLPLELRDLDSDRRPRLPASLEGADWRIFRVAASAGLDPSLPLEFQWHVTRSKGQVYPERVHRALVFEARLPAAYVQPAEAQAEGAGWQAPWRTRAPEIGVLLAALALLAVLLARPGWLGASPRRLRGWRNAYLLFTLVFVGWWAQGQLSIVNLSALVQALRAGRSLDFFLYDPISLLLWLAVGLSVWFWGRGTFCGWLCPFGALQDLLSQLARRLGLRPRRVPEAWDRRLKGLKHGVLLSILLAACFSATWTDRLVEVEPFKTSITLGFVRGLPFVLWALAWLVAGLFFYKSYCRYLCPLGAAMVWLGRLRRLAWIARRAECGQPCQRCRSDCAYQAIGRSGAVDYDECFQCLDCVLIYHSEQLCVPRIQHSRRTGPPRLIPLVVVPAKEESQ